MHYVKRVIYTLKTKSSADKALPKKATNIFVSPQKNVYSKESCLQYDNRQHNNYFLKLLNNQRNAHNERDNILFSIWTVYDAALLNQLLNWFNIWQYIAIHLKL